MKKAVLVLLVLSLMLYSDKVFSLEICNPSQEYIKYSKLSEEEKKNNIEPYYCEKNKKQESILKSPKNIIFDLFSSVSDSYYNAYDDNIVTQPEHQGTLGTCWAFSSLSAVQTNAMKNGFPEYNLSESHLLYSVLAVLYKDEAGKKGKYITPNINGGKVTYTATYFFNSIGQLLENEMPYQSQEIPIYSSQYPNGNSILSLGGFELSNFSDYGVCSNDEISNIKRDIVRYGSVQAAMHYKESLFDNTHNYYLATLSTSNDPHFPNHAIVIVGWDDTISKNNFPNATRDGAFIIKNSWGPDWSDDGLFYISYDDHFICKDTTTFYDVSNKSFKYTYTASDVVGEPMLNYKNELYITTKFTKKVSSPESLKRIGFPVGDNSDYYIYLSRNNNINNQSTWELLTHGTSESIGIKTFDIDDLVLYDDFTIIVKYVSHNNGSTIFAMCNNKEDLAQMEISNNTNYFSTNATTWKDMNSVLENVSCEPAIYAYTNDVSSEESVIINALSSSNNNFYVNITINNIDTSTISYKILDENNLDVTSSFNIIPNYVNNIITIKSNNLISGQFSFVIQYGNISISKLFMIRESIVSNDPSIVSISGKYVSLNIDGKKSLTRSELLQKIAINNSGVSITNSDGHEVYNSDLIATDYKIHLEKSTYSVVVMGDSNGDGMITALDYIQIRNHIMGKKITNNAKLLASDVNHDSNISALDYIGIRKIIMR